MTPVRRTQAMIMDMHHNCQEFSSQMSSKKRNCVWFVSRPLFTYWLYVLLVV